MYGIPEVYIEIVKNRLGVVDGLVFTQHIVPDLERAGVAVTSDPGKHYFKTPVTTFKQLSIGTLETFAQWEREGKLYAIITGNPVSVLAAAKGFFGVLPILARSTIFLGTLKKALEKEG